MLAIADQVTTREVPSPENHALLCGGATLCAVVASAGATLIDFRAIGKTVCRFCTSPPELQAPAEVRTIAEPNMGEDQVEWVAGGLRCPKAIKVFFAADEDAAGGRHD